MSFHHYIVSFKKKNTSEFFTVEHEKVKIFITKHIDKIILITLSNYMYGNLITILNMEYG